MKRTHFNAYFDYMLNQVKETRDDGQKEYARAEDNVFANFDRVADCLKIPSEKALMVYLLKHIDGISSYIEGHESQREDVSGRIKDAIVYLFLLWAMIDGQRELDAIKEPIISSYQKKFANGKTESLL
tara:strand:- start:363 stop:746 length:384 start_codon:yes stop_codon:yes gene_type:complete